MTFKLLSPGKIKRRFWRRVPVDVVNDVSFVVVSGQNTEKKAKSQNTEKNKSQNT